MIGEGAPLFVVVVSGVVETQRNTIHAVVARTSNGWWYEVPDVWIVRGQQATFWRDLIRPYVLPNAEIFVMKLDNVSPSVYGWATFAAKAKGDWLEKHWRLP